MFDDAAPGARRLPRIAHFLPPHGPPRRSEWDQLVAADRVHHRTDRTRHPPTLSGHDLMRMFPAESPASARARCERRAWPASSSSEYFADEERHYFAQRERPRATQVCAERVAGARARGGAFNGMLLSPMGDSMRLRTDPVWDGVAEAAGDCIDDDDDGEEGGEDEADTDGVVNNFRMGMTEGEGASPGEAMRSNPTRDRKSAAAKHHAALHVRRPPRDGDRVCDPGPGRPGALRHKEKVSAPIHSRESAGDELRFPSGGRQKSQSARPVVHARGEHPCAAREHGLSLCYTSVDWQKARWARARPDDPHTPAMRSRKWKAAENNL